MSVISDLIDKVNDPDLRARLNEEVARMQKQKKFGLVFEEHLPEATPLYETAVSVGSLVSLKDKEFKEFFRVKQMKSETLVCEREDDSHVKAKGFFCRQHGKKMWAEYSAHIDYIVTSTVC